MVITKIRKEVVVCLKKAIIEKLKKESKEIKKESFDEFLNSFELNQLRNCVLISLLFKEKLELDLNDSTKEDYIDCIKNNLEALTDNLVEIIDFNLLDLLYDIVNSKGTLLI